MPKHSQFTRQQRFNWYKQLEQRHRTVKDVCEVWGISRKTYYYWYKRDHPWLRDHNYHPVKRQPNTKLIPSVKQFIEEQKLITNYGPLKMKMLVERVGA